MSIDPAYMEQFSGMNRVLEALRTKNVEPALELVTHTRTCTHTRTHIHTHTHIHTYTQHRHAHTHFIRTHSTIYCTRYVVCVSVDDVPLSHPHTLHPHTLTPSHPFLTPLHSSSHPHRWAMVHRVRLQQHGSSLEFRLRQLKFLSLLSTGRTQEALAYAKVLGQFVPKHTMGKSH